MGVGGKQLGPAWEMGFHGLQGPARAAGNAESSIVTVGAKGELPGGACADQTIELTLQSHYMCHMSKNTSRECGRRSNEEKAANGRERRYVAQAGRN
jgi:hypothetical protein